MELAIEYRRFKQIRQELQFTQRQFAKRLNLPSSTADIERGKTRLSGEVVMILLRDYNINPLWLFDESKTKHLNLHKPSVMPKVISTNQKGAENILIVDAKASAGYGQNIGDIEYYEQLPAFDFPLADYRNETFRGFQISGNSMIPLVYSGDYVLAKAIESFDEVKDEEIYIIVQEDAIRLKKVRKSNNHLTLISLNPDYPPQQIENESILEIWEYYAKISRNKDNEMPSMLESIFTEIQSIKTHLAEK